MLVITPCVGIAIRQSAAGSLRMVHAHLENHDICLIRAVEYIHRNADMIVEIGMRLMNNIFFGQYGCRHFLGGRLAVRARDSDHLP